MYNSSSIKAGAVISYISVFLTIAITFFYTPWMIRQIGVSDYGLYSLVITFIAYFVMDFGMSGTVTRFLAKYRAEGDNQKIENLMGLILKVFLTIDALIFVVLFVVFFFIEGIFQGLSLDELEKLKVLYAIAGLFSVLSFAFKPMHGAMMAFEFFVETKLIGMIQKVGTVSLIVVALFLGMGVYSLVFINGAVAFGSSLLFFFLFRKKTKVKINFHYFEMMEMKSLLSYSMWVFLVSLAQRFRLTFMPSLLGMMSNSTQISLFSLGMSIEGMVFVLSSALNGLFLPRVTRLNYQGNSNEITNLMIRVGRIQLYIISIIFFGFFILGDDFLQLWVGNNFHDTYYVVLLLIAPNIVNLTQNIAGDLVAAKNKVRYTATLTFVASGLALVGAIVLAPKMGAVGCALAFGCAMGLNIIQINYFYRKNLNLDVRKFFVECHLKILPIIIIVSILFYILKTFVSTSTWLSLLLFGCLFAVTMSVMCYVALFNDGEKLLIKQVLLKRR